MDFPSWLASFLVIMEKLLFSKVEIVPHIGWKMDFEH